MQLLHAVEHIQQLQSSRAKGNGVGGLNCAWHSARCGSGQNRKSAILAWQTVAPDGGARHAFGRGKDAWRRPLQTAAAAGDARRRPPLGPQGQPLLSCAKWPEGCAPFHPPPSRAAGAAGSSAETKGRRERARGASAVHRSFSRALIEEIDHSDLPSAPDAHSFALLKTPPPPCPSGSDRDCRKYELKASIKSQACPNSESDRCPAGRALLLSMLSARVFQLIESTHNRRRLMSLRDCYQGQPATGDLRSQVQALLASSQPPREYSAPSRRKAHPLYPANGGGGTAARRQGGSSCSRAASQGGRSRSQPPSPTGISKARPVRGSSSRGPVKGEGHAWLNTSTGLQA